MMPPLVSMSRKKGSFTWPSCATTAPCRGTEAEERSTGPKFGPLACPTAARVGTTSPAAPLVSRHQQTLTTVGGI
eukprot:scaffold16092_cov127-Isochrysis_galbana.AAC.3